MPAPGGIQKEKTRRKLAQGWPKPVEHEHTNPLDQGAPLPDAESPEQDPAPSMPQGWVKSCLCNQAPYLTKPWGFTNAPDYDRSANF